MNDPTHIPLWIEVPLIVCLWILVLVIFALKPYLNFRAQKHRSTYIAPTQGESNDAARQRR